MIELQDCTRMNARITQAQCDKNRKGVPKAPGRNEQKPCLSCEGCPGLGKPDVKIEKPIPVEEIKPMAAVKVCGAEGCNSLQHARGYCWKHERSILGVDPATGKPLASKEAPKRGRKAATKVKAPDAPATPPDNTPIMVSDHPIEAIIIATDLGPLPASAVDMIREVDAAFAKKKEDWLYDLVNSTSLRSRAKIYVAMSDALEGLVY